MDYHGWMLLEQSLGHLEYGVEFNRAVVGSDQESGLLRKVAALWQRITAQAATRQKKAEMLPAATGECCSHA
jgi:hypothetical protein